MADRLRLGWGDAPALARQLHARFPRLDPIAARMADIPRWVLEVPGFEGVPKGYATGELEAIQRAWYAIYCAAGGSG